MIVVVAVVDGDVIFVDVNGAGFFVVVDVDGDIVFVVDDVDGDDVFLVVDFVNDIRVVAPDGTSHVTPTSPPLPPEKSKHIFLSSIKTKSSIFARRLEKEYALRT